jgi:hypothetical protein
MGLFSSFFINEIKAEKSQQEEKKSIPQEDRNVNIKTFVDAKELPEYRIIDTALLRLAEKEVILDVEETLIRFVNKRDLVVQFLNKQKISTLNPFDLNVLFDATAMLAAGRESNFIRKEYRAVLVQLTFN